MRVKKRVPRSRRKKKAKNARRKKKAVKAQAVSASTSIYKPHEYSEARKEFIKEAREGGMSYKESQSAWASSQQRSKLLAGMTEAELKRRRFI